MGKQTCGPLEQAGRDGVLRAVALPRLDQLRTGEPIRVILAGIPPLVRAGLRATLASEPDIRVDGEFEHGDATLRPDPDPAPDVLLLDPRPPGSPLGAILARLRAARPDVPIILVAERAEAGRAGDLLALGVAGCLLTDDAPATVAPAIRLVRQGGLWLGPALRAGPAGGPGGPAPVPLTAREREVLALLAVGQGNAAIAAALCVSVRTVDYHVRNLLTKLGAHSRTEAIYQARCRGALPRDAPPPAPARKAG